MSSQTSGRVLIRYSTEKEIVEKIEKLRQKYGMDFDEFFELTESGLGKLVRRGFDPEEVLKDISEWEDLESLKEKTPEHEKIHCERIS